MKSNIGHLENASGIAGLIKSILSVEKGLILPNADFQKPGKRLQLEEDNLIVRVLDHIFFSVMLADS